MVRFQFLLELIDLARMVWDGFNLNYLNNTLNRGEFVCRTAFTK